MPDGSTLTFIGMFLCLVFSAFFSASETAFTSMNKTKMKNKVQEGNKTAALALKMVNNYDKLLSTILIGNNIVNVALTAMATAWFIAWFELIQTNLSASTVSTAVITVAVLIFGEITPKSIAKDHPEGFAIGVARLLRLIQLILTPFNLIFMGWKKLINLIFKPSNIDTVTEGEVLTLVDEAHEDGSIDEYNKELIENIFAFDDMTAGEIATHRTEITMLCIDDTVEEWNDAINNSRYSRYPVYGENIDDIIGILDARAYFRLEEKTREVIMAEAITPAYFVPESVKADVLFKNMKAKKEYFAVVLDEYGGVYGIITLTDLVECIVGEFTESHEDEDEEADIVLIEENKWQISGTASVQDVRDALGIAINDEDSETFGGYVLGLYGSVPEDGSKFEVSADGLEIHVEDIKEHVIEKTIVILKPEEKED
ncbi:MAG: HlyC/CorC family transporter [Clostridia bacterium]|nr:HlyC/CorC family transporter [Clostridia bacterium]